MLKDRCTFVCYVEHLKGSKLYHYFRVPGGKRQSASSLWPSLQLFLQSLHCKKMNQLDPYEAILKPHSAERYILAFWKYFQHSR